MSRQSVVNRTPVSESGMRLGDVHPGQKVILVDLLERTYLPFTVIKAPFVLTEYDPVYPDSEPYRVLLVTLRDGLGQDLDYFPELLGTLPFEFDGEWFPNRYLIPARKAHLLPEELELIQDGTEYSTSHEDDYDEIFGETFYDEAWNDYWRWSFDRSEQPVFQPDDCDSTSSLLEEQAAEIARISAVASIVDSSLSYVSEDDRVANELFEQSPSGMVLDEAPSYLTKDDRPEIDRIGYELGLTTLEEEIDKSLDQRFGISRDDPSPL